MSYFVSHYQFIFFVIVSIIVWVSASFGQTYLTTGRPKSPPKDKQVVDQTALLGETHPELVTLLNLLAARDRKGFWSSFWTNAAQNGVFTVVGIVAGLYLSRLN